MNRKSFNEKTLLEVEEFCGKLNIADNTGPDYMRTKWVCKDFQIKNLGEYMICILKGIH